MANMICERQAEYIHNITRQPNRRGSLNEDWQGAERRKQ